MPPATTWTRIGAGILPSGYERQGIATEAVDIDPEVVKLARDYFGNLRRMAGAIREALQDE